MNDQIEFPKNLSRMLYGYWTTGDAAYLSMIHDIMCDAGAPEAAEAMVDSARAGLAAYSKPGALTAEFVEFATN